MKKIKDYLEKIDREYFVNYESQRIFNSISKNPKMIHKFRDMKIIEIMELCKTEINKLYDYLLSFVNKDTVDKSEIDDDAIFILPDYSLTSKDKNYIDGCIILTFNNIKKYGIEAAPSVFRGWIHPKYMVNFYVSAGCEKYVDNFIDEIIYYSWPMFYYENSNENVLLKEFLLNNFNEKNTSRDFLDITDIPYKKIPKIIINFENIDYKFRVDMWKIDIDNLWHCLREEKII